jgi:hypothetical protein
VRRAGALAGTIPAGSAPRPVLENTMDITVRNTTSQTGRVTLFGELQDGSFVARIMGEDQVPYSRYWDNQVEQAMVYIEPDAAQLAAILAALNERRLAFRDLQNYGGSAGGTSTIPV